MSNKYYKDILGKQLLERNLLNHKQLKDAFNIKNKTNQRLSSILKEKGIVNKIELYKIISNLINIPIIDNYNLNILDDLNIDIVKNFDERVLIEKQFLPINFNNNILKIMVFDFKDKSIDNLLKTKFGDILIEKIETSKKIISYFIEYSYKDKLIDEELNKQIKQESPTQENLFTIGQLIFIGFIIITFVTGLFFKFNETINYGLFIVNFFFLLFTLYKFVFPIFNVKQKYNKEISQKEFFNQVKKDLPAYTILVPIIDNKGSLDNLILSLKKMDYSSEKMEVIFLLKNNDSVNRKALLNANLLDNWIIINIPKEISDQNIKIYNLGLKLAKGEYITTYTSKDLPEPNQLKKVIFSYNHKSNNNYRYIAPYSYINNNSLLSKFINLEMNQIINYAKSNSKFYNRSAMLIKGTIHDKTDKLRNNRGWSNSKNLFLMKNDSHFIAEIFDSTTYLVLDNKGMNYYIELFINYFKELLYSNRKLLNKTKQIYKNMITNNIFLFTALITPILYMILIFVIFLKLFVNESLLNQYILNYLVNFSIGNFVLFYLVNIYLLVKSEINIKMKDKIKMSLINPVFMIIKFYAVIKAVVKILKNPYKLEFKNPNPHRDLMFMHIDFKKK